MPPPKDPPVRPAASGQPSEPLIVEDEGNGLVLGKRRSTHASILDSLEDPRLEVDAECDLHGHTVREAENV